MAASLSAQRLRETRHGRPAGSAGWTSRVDPWTRPGMSSLQGGLRRRRLANQSRPMIQPSPRCVQCVADVSPGKEGRMSAQSNGELMRKGYEAFSRGDMDTLKHELFSPDIVWHQGGRNQTAGDYRGADAVIGLFGKLFQLTDGTFRVTVDDLLTSE